MSNIKISEGVYEPHGKVVNITNGTIELSVLVEHGPRVLRYGFVGGRNHFEDFKTVPGVDLDVDGEMWHLFGGHRLWLASEEFPRTYIPDNESVDWEEIPGGIMVTAKPQPIVCFGRQMEITIDETGAGVHIKHRVFNYNPWAVETAIWAGTVVKKGGIEIIPQVRRNSTFLDGAANIRTCVVWPYTPYNDPRLLWGDRYNCMITDSSIDHDVKIGYSNADGWAAYLNDGEVFVKKFNYMPEATYPEYHIAYITYTCKNFLEMETYSPLMKIPPKGGSIEHDEYWMINKCDTSFDPKDESTIDAFADKYFRDFITK